jgi:hypothetical protein
MGSGNNPMGMFGSTKKIFKSIYSGFERRMIFLLEFFEWLDVSVLCHI